MSKTVHPHPLLATLDDDRGLVDLFRKHKLAPGSCRRTKRQALLKWKLAPASTSLVFIRRNLETVVQDLKVINPALVDNTGWERALNKELVQRDEVFQAAATEVQRDLRGRLLKKNSSLKYLVDQVRNLLGP